MFGRNSRKVGAEYVLVPEKYYCSTHRDIELTDLVHEKLGTRVPDSWLDEVDLSGLAGSHTLELMVPVFGVGKKSDFEVLVECPGNGKPHDQVMTGVVKEK